MLLYVQERIHLGDTSGYVPSHNMQQEPGHVEQRLR